MIRAMEKFKMTDADGNDLIFFEERDQGAALHYANEYDRINGLTGTTLWVQSGPLREWYAI